MAHGGLRSSEPLGQIPDQASRAYLRRCGRAQISETIGRVVRPGSSRRRFWGTEPHIVQLFGAQAADITCTRKMFNFRYKSADHWIQVFRDYYGPTHKAFGALDAAGQKSLEAGIKDVLNQLNIGGSRSLVVPGEYLETVIRKH